MELINFLRLNVPGCDGVSDRGDGTYRLDFGDVTRDATEAEILAARRSSVWEQIKTERDRRQRAQGYVAGGKRFHSDDSSRIQQLGLVMLGSNIPPDLQWKTMDGSFVTMTPALAQAVFAAAAISDIALFGFAEQLRAQANASSDPESIDITTGWPE